MDVDLMTRPGRGLLLETEALGYDATLVAHLEPFRALGIDILALQLHRGEREAGESEEPDAPAVRHRR
jgi:hypothetical protein